MFDNKYVKYAGYGIIALLIIVALSTTIHRFQLNHELSNTTNTVNQLDAKYQKMVEKGEPKIISTPNGKVDTNAAGTIKTINKLFTKINKYTSTKEYNNNRNYAKKIVSDESFFGDNGFLSSAYDNDGNSILEAYGGLKSEPDYVNAYQLASNHYYVIVSRFAYTNPKAMDYKDKLKATIVIFDIRGNSNNLTSVKQFDNLHGLD